VFKARLLRWTQSGRRAYKVPERGLFAHVIVSALPYRFLVALLLLLLLLLLCLLLLPTSTQHIRRATASPRL
jgi:hypothetical protein